MYHVDAKTEVRYLKIYASQLTEFAQQIEQDSGEMEVTTIEQTREESELTMQLFQDLASGNVSLPSLPDVAFKIQKSI